ncbi:MAG: hypothetical protein CM15mP62_21710 [Rhodospirillaceae bacterium]|nr:MAG: hypothetical protein CM15mP62_21710 [Rhodospirillaceae bacterium]
MHFGDRLIKSTHKIGNPLCVGLDPYLDKIPPSISKWYNEA